ncbi:1213_t:CDS:2, partial [Racocetra fulgida]
DTEVSLQIIKALLEACHKDLKLFSKNIVKIITASLSTNDIDLVACATSVFITFCHYYDGSTLGVDTEFTEIYEGLIELFAKYATIKESDANNEKSAVTSDALQPTSAKVQLRHIVPAILYNLIDDLNGLETLQKADHELVNELRRFSANVTTISVKDNTNLAYNCLKQLFEVSDPSYINYSLESAFNFLEDTAMWAQSNFIISLTSTILSSLKQLEALPTGSSPTPKKVSLVKALTFILTSDTPLVGLSILEVLDCLLRLLLSSLKNSDCINEYDNATDSNESDLLICQQLTSCIG